MSEIKKEQAEAYCDSRKADVDKWESKETKTPKVALAFWVWSPTGKDKERVHVVGNSLEEAVELAMVKENLIQKHFRDKQDDRNKSK